MPQSESEASQANSRPRDWFGYVLTTAIGISATVLVAWYQLYITQKEAAAAELERARAVKQIAVAIVEEHALHAKRLEVDRLARLIDQRRRDESISIPISVSEVVEQAEFNIASSHHLSVDRKEEIKPTFDSFYSELRSRQFQPIAGGRASSSLLNEAAKKIQEGKSADALAILKRLDEAYAQELVQATKASRPSIAEGLNDIFSSPWKATLFSTALLVYSVLAWRFLRRRLRPASPFDRAL